MREGIVSFRASHKVPSGGTGLRRQNRRVEMQSQESTLSKRRKEPLECCISSCVGKRFLIPSLQESAGSTSCSFALSLSRAHDITGSIQVDSR